QRVFQILDGAQNQFGPIVRGDNLYTGRKTSLDVMELLLNAIDQLESVLPLPHDHDPGYRLPGSVPVRDAAPDIRPERYVAHVGDANRNSALIFREHDLADVVSRLRISTAAHHVLGAAEFHQSPADVIVAAAHCVHYFADRDIERLELVRVNIDLVLPHEAAQRRDLGDTRNRLEAIAQVPVLVAAQVGQALLARCIDKGILKYPADTSGVWPQFGFDALRQARQDVRKILQSAGTRPVNVGAFLKDDVDIRVA